MFECFLKPSSTSMTFVHACFSHQGDKYFRTGDLLKQDNEGYWYFVDR